VDCGKPAKSVVKRGRFEKKVILCMWWNFEGVDNFELTPDGQAIDSDMYSAQLD